MAINVNMSKASTARTYHSPLTTTASTAIYTVPVSHTAKVECIHLTNVGAGNATFHLHVVSAALGLTMHLFHLVTIASKGYLTIDKLPLNLGSGDVIQVTADTANHIAVTISLDESYDPNSTHG